MDSFPIVVPNLRAQTPQYFTTTQQSAPPIDWQMLVQQPIPLPDPKKCMMEFLTTFENSQIVCKEYDEEYEKLLKKKNDLLAQIDKKVNEINGEAVQLSKETKMHFDQAFNYLLNVFVTPLNKEIDEITHKLDELNYKKAIVLKSYIEQMYNTSRYFV